MSRNQCNYCLVKNIKEKARRKGKKVTITNSTWRLGGKNVYMHPPNISLKNVPEDSTLHKKYFAAWVMMLPKECAC